jgi:hypothetical protein
MRIERIEQVGQERLAVEHDDAKSEFWPAPAGPKNGVSRRQIGKP